MTGAGDDERGDAQDPRQRGENRRPRSGADAEAEADPRTADTTRWAGAASPPILVEEETAVDEQATVVASQEPPPAVAPPPDLEPPPAAAPPPDLEPPPGTESDAEATVVAARAREPEGDVDATVVAAPASEPVPEPAAVPVPDADAEATVVARVGEATAEPTSRATIPPSSALHPMLLERVEPSLGRGERLRLDAAHWHVRLGRAEHNEIRLYTASASREQAEIRGNERGEWVLTPAEGKSLLVDGEPVDEPIVLEVGMNLVMGGDHLRCVTEGLASHQMTAQTAAEGLDDARSASAFGRLGGMAWLTLASGALGVGLLLYAWLAG